MKDLGARFRLGERFYPHHSHMAHSLAVLHKFKHCLVFNAVVSGNGLCPSPRLVESMLLHLVNYVQIGIDFVLHLLFYLLVVVFIRNAGYC